MTKRVMLSETRGVDLDAITACRKVVRIDPLVTPAAKVEYDVAGNTLTLFGKEAEVLWALWESLSEKPYKRYEEVKAQK